MKGKNLILALFGTKISSPFCLRIVLNPKTIRVGLSLLVGAKSKEIGLVLLVGAKSKGIGLVLLLNHMKIFAPISKLTAEWKNKHILHFGGQIQS